MVLCRVLEEGVLGVGDCGIGNLVVSLLVILALLSHELMLVAGFGGGWIRYEGCHSEQAEEA